MNIAIIEDEPGQRDVLCILLKRYFEKHHLYCQIQTFSNAELFLEAFQPQIFDAVFLDIYLDEMNGMELARRIREKDDRVLLIFNSVTEDFAVESYDVRAFYYMIKPFDYRQLSRVLDLGCRTLSAQNRYIEVKESRLLVKVRLSDILYVDSSNHYVQLHTAKRIVKSYMPFREISEILLKQPQFLLCYRNCILNMDYVASLQQHYFLLKNGEKVAFAQAQRSHIRQQFLNYEFERLDQNGLTY